MSVLDDLVHADEADGAVVRSDLNFVVSDVHQSLDSLDLSVTVLDCGARWGCAFGMRLTALSGIVVTCAPVSTIALTMRCLLPALVRKACWFLLIRSDRVVAFCVRRDDLVPGCGELIMVLRIPTRR